MAKKSLNNILIFEWLFWIAACTTSVFLSPVSYPILFTIYFLALPMFAILRSAAGLPVLPPKNIAMPLIGLLFIVLFSAVVTPNLSFSLRKISGLINSLGLFTALLTSTPPRWQLSNWLLLFFGIVIASVGAIGSDIYARIPLLFPFFRPFYLIVPLLPAVQRVINANLIAGALLWTLPVTTGLVVYYHQKKTVWLTALTTTGLFIQAYLLILMQSRAALLATLIVGLGAIWITVSRARNLIRNTGLACIAIAILLFVPIWPTSVEAEIQMIYFNLLIKGDEGEQGLDSIDDRVQIWRRALEKISEKPVTGHGLNMFRKIANQPTPVFNPPKEIPHAHNWAMQITLELGLIGLFFYGWLIVAASSNLLAAWRNKRSVRPVVLGYAAALLGFMLFGLLDTISPGARPDFIFWILLAGALSQSAQVPTRPDLTEAAL